MNLPFLTSASVSHSALCNEAEEAVFYLLNPNCPPACFAHESSTDTNGWVFNLNKYGAHWRKADSYDVTLQDVFELQNMALFESLVSYDGNDDFGTCSQNFQRSSQRKDVKSKDIVASSSRQNIENNQQVPTVSGYASQVPRACMKTGSAHKSASQPHISTMPIYSAPIPQLTGRVSNLLTPFHKTSTFLAPAHAPRVPLPATPVQVPQLSHRVMSLGTSCYHQRQMTSHASLKRHLPHDMTSHHHVSKRHVQFAPSSTFTWKNSHQTFPGSLYQ